MKERQGIRNARKSHEHTSSHVVLIPGFSSTYHRRLIGDFCRDSCRQAHGPYQVHLFQCENELRTPQGNSVTLTCDIRIAGFWSSHTFQIRLCKEGNRELMMLLRFAHTLSSSRRGRVGSIMSRQFRDFGQRHTNNSQISFV